MNPNLRNFFIITGILVGAWSAYTLYKWNKNKSDSNTETGAGATQGKGASPVDESKVTADAKNNPLRVYR